MLVCSTHAKLTIFPNICLHLSTNIHPKKKSLRISGHHELTKQRYPAKSDQPLPSNVPSTSNLTGKDLPHPLPPRTSPKPASRLISPYRYCWSPSPRHQGSRGCTSDTSPAVSARRFNTTGARYRDLLLFASPRLAKHREIWAG